MSTSISYGQQRSELATLCEHVSASPANDITPWPCFDEVQARIDGFRNEVFVAITLARTQLLRNESDAAACEIAIQASLALGDRPGASYILGAYEESLKREIGAAPPPYLQRLLNA